MKLLKYGALATVLIIVILNKLYWQEVPAQELASFDCYQLDEGCLISADKIKVKISSNTKIKTMHQFTLTIQQRDNSGFKPNKVSYNMKEMDMGLNEYTFTSQGDNDKQWQSDALIPFCVSGLSEWVATIYFTNEQLETVFIKVMFNVANKT